MCWFQSAVLHIRLIKQPRLCCRDNYVDTVRRAPSRASQIEDIVLLVITMARVTYSSIAYAQAEILPTMRAYVRACVRV